MPGNFRMDRQGVAGYIRQGMNFELKARAAGPLIWRLLLLAALALALSGAAAPAVAQQAAPSPEAVAESRDRVLGGGAYQTERPQEEAPPRREQLPPWLVKAILWTAGIVVAAMIAYFLFNLALELWGSRFSLLHKRNEPAAETARVETVAPAQREKEQRTLAEADALAAEGRFAEAIHLLLLVAMERLRGELGPRLAPAMTGREVLHLAALPGAAAEPLGRMVALSEIKHFGGREASAPDYRVCRADFLKISGLEPASA